MNITVTGKNNNFKRMNTVLSTWFLLFCIAVLLVMFRDDHNKIIGDLTCRVFYCKRLGYSIITMALIFVVLPFTIPLSIYHIWRQ
jgi:hypothetical protein